MSEPTNNSLWNQDIAVCREVLHSEAGVLQKLAAALDAESFGRAVDLILSCEAQVVVTGMGKSGHIGAKIAATLASTGSPAFFMHPGEALHGDLGMITRKNVVLALSQSGASDEVLHLMPYIKHLRVPLIAVTGKCNSPLAEKADVVLCTAIDQEACPLNLAPTSSTTAQLALGDALAIALMKRRGFTPDDYAMRHPLGALGRKLLLKVSDVMHTGVENPIVPEATPLHAAILVLAQKRWGAISIVDSEGKLAGIFTNGDLSRLFTKLHGEFDTSTPISTYMIRSPKFVTPETLGVKAIDMMETYKITALPVLDRDRVPVGIVHEHDLVRLGLGG